jgi:hypothetical protein
LVLLDNATGEAQVRPLLPPSSCGLLVTSREAIALAGLKPLTLGQLSPGEAKELLMNSAQRSMLDGVAEEICKLCGFLPLAVRAAGSLLNTDVTIDAADFATQLRDERRRLERLGTSGVEISVEATLNLSYEKLPKDTARTFLCLAVFPSSFDAAAEEVVCEDLGHTHLSALVRLSLVLFDE